MASSSEDETSATDWRNMRRPAAASNKQPLVPSEPSREESASAQFCPVFVRPVSAGTSTNAPKERTLRKGEFGKKPEELAQLEKSGFVMSGARSNRIAMIREMKQAAEPDEEQRKGQLMERMTQREEREDALIESFREILKRKRENS